MKTINIWALCMVAIFVSFLGFVVENIWLAITKGYMDNRNMCLPFLMGYGMAMLLIFWILGTPEKPWLFGKSILIKNRILKRFLYFAGVMLCVCVGEILLGTFVEKTCHFCWWDYSPIPFHITRYTSIPTSTLFSVAVTFFMDIVLKPLYNFFQRWNSGFLKVAVVVLMVLMTGDFLYNAYKMYKTQGMVRRWRISVGIIGMMKGRGKDCCVRRG